LRSILILETYTTSDIADLPTGLECNTVTLQQDPRTQKLTTSPESDLQATDEGHAVH
jgi:hypothetical protein